MALADNSASPLLEVCVDNLESVKATVNGGAKRIELCSSLLEGGLTPSYGFMKHVKSTFPDLTVFVMIRPRGGDFCYCKEELDIMLHDIDCLKGAGADGFVFGCLLPDGSIDIDSNKCLLGRASPMPCTFHRAFDMTRDPEKSLENIIELGFARILTSGQSNTAIEGLDKLKHLAELSKGRIIIMPGSGVNSDNLAHILQSCQANEYHCSASSLRLSSMEYRNANINMGSNSSEFTWKVADTEKIKLLLNISSKLHLN